MTDLAFGRCMPIARLTLPGLICIEPEGLPADHALANWVQQGLAFASGLPAKANARALNH